MTKWSKFMANFRVPSLKEASKCCYMHAYKTNHEIFLKTRFQTVKHFKIPLRIGGRRMVMYIGDKRA